jgi:hypothetical protein
MTVRVNAFPSSHPNIASVEQLSLYDLPLDAVLPHTSTWMLCNSATSVSAFQGYHRHQYPNTSSQHLKRVWWVRVNAGVPDPRRG